MKEDTKIAKEYAELVDRQVQAIQEGGEAPSTYMFEYNGKRWLLTLPRSVMAQKRLIFLRNKMATEGTFEAEDAFIRAIIENTQVNGRTLRVEDYTLDELEVLKLAYTDGLIVPLFLGGDRAIRAYMSSVTTKGAA